MSNWLGMGQKVCRYGYQQRNLSGWKDRDKMVSILAIAREPGVISSRYTWWLVARRNPEPIISFPSRQAGTARLANPSPPNIQSLFHAGTSITFTAPSATYSP